MIDAVVVRTVPYATLGALLGGAYFVALEWNVRLYTSRCTAVKALLLHLTRVGLATAGFMMFARQGAAPLLAGFAGFLIVRTLTVMRYGLVAARNS